MECKYKYCIYNKNSLCLLDEVRIDRTGQCESCVMVWLPDGKLEEYKDDNIIELMESI